MSDTYEEPSTYFCHDVHYEATRGQANDIASYVAGLPESERLETVEAVLQHGTFLVHAPLVMDSLRALAAERAALRSKLHDLVRLRVREMGIEA